MSNPSRSRSLLIAPTSIAAAMLMAGPAFAADAEADAAAVDAEVAQQAKSGIHVNGQRQEINLPTVRGPIIDVPQIVSTVSAETLKERQVISLEQALRNVAGVTTQIGEGGVVNGDQFFIRGQSAKNDIFTDGLRDFGAFTRDSFNYEQVEVLKGSSSTALGRGVSGGAINTTSKMPATSDFFAATGSAGSANYGRITVDANKALSDSIGLRLNFMAHRNDSADRDLVESQRWGFAPAIGFGIGERTSLTLIYFHQEEDRVPDYGVPIAVTTAADIEVPVTELGVPRSNFYGYDADTDHVTVNTLTAKFQHEANDWLSFTSDTKLGVYKRYFRQTVASCAAACGDALTDGNSATVPLATMGGPGPYDQTTKGIQNVTTALITKPVGGMRSELLLGVDFSYQTNDRTQSNYAGTRAQKDLFDPAHSPSPALSTTLNNIRDTRGTDISLFIDERLWLTPQFSINAGLRYQHFTNKQEQTSYNATTCDGVAGTYAECFYTRKSEHNLLNPKISAIWEPSDKASVYLSYSKAATPPGNAIGNGDALSALGTNGTISSSDLDPEKTETFDLGAKFGLFHNKLLVQTAIYQINRSNAKETDQQTQTTVASSEPKQRLRGFELGLSGAVSKEVLLTANYTFVDAEIREAFSSGAPDPLAIGKQVRFVPKHAASAWASWKPADGALTGLEVGGGANYQSKVYLNNQNTQVAPSYVVFDALLGYSFGNYRVAVNGYNLTNKLYYAQVNGGRVLPAAGRTFVASFGIAF